jgi:hypothetical protein
VLVADATIHAGWVSDYTVKVTDGIVCAIVPKVSHHDESHRRSHRQPAKLGNQIVQQTFGFAS